MAGKSDASSDIVLVVAMGYDIRLAEWHLQHYKALGVTRILLDIQTGSGNTDLLLKDVEKAAEKHGAEIVYTEPGRYLGTRQRRERLVDRFCEPGDWLVVADVDEFHEYPASLHRIVHYCESGGYDFVMGELVDRLACDGTLPDLDERPLSAQFPLGSNLTRNLCGGWARKVVICRNNVSLGEGNHEALSGTCCPQDRIYVPVHHFRWDSLVLEKSRFMIESIKCRGSDHWIEKSRFLRHLERNDGKIDVGDPELNIRFLEGTIPASSDSVIGSGAKALISPESRLHKRPKIAPRSWFEIGYGTGVVHGPRGTIHFSDTECISFLWRQCHGRSSIRQLELNLSENLDSTDRHAHLVLRRTMEQLQRIGAMEFRRDTEPVSHTDTRVNLRLLYLDDRVPRPSDGYLCDRSAAILGSLASNGFDVIFFPLSGTGPNDNRDVVALERLGISVVSSHREISLRNFLATHLELFDVIWASRAGIFRELLEALAVRSWRPRLVYDCEHSIGARMHHGGDLQDNSPDGNARALSEREMDLIGSADITVSASLIDDKRLGEKCIYRVFHMGTPPASATRNIKPCSRRDIPCLIDQTIRLMNRQLRRDTT